MDEPYMTGLALCPACGTEVEIDSDAVLGELVFCGECGVELELIALSPVRLALYEDEEK